MTLNPPPADGEIRQLLVHPVVWASLELWLAFQGLDLHLVKAADDSDPATYAMSPAQYVIDAANREAGQ